MNQYDVLIIGGGPGGAVCARELARAGFEVLLLERDAPGRFKACAGGIPPRVGDISPMPPELVERDIHGGLLVAPDLTQAVLRAPSASGHIVFRTAYDQHLRHLAMDAGAEVLHGARARSISRSGKDVTVEATTAKGARTFRGRCLVGAFGISPGHGLLKQLGVTRPPCMFSCMMEVKLDPDALDERVGNVIETYLDSRITPTGSAWIYPKRAGAAVGIISYTRSQGQSFKAKLRAFMNEHPVASAKLAGWEPYFDDDPRRSYFGHLIPRALVARSYGDRFVLLGDAAGAADPLTGEGIYHAQITGQIAARVLAENLRDDRLDATTLGEYERRWHKVLYHQSTKLTGKAARTLYGYPHFNRLSNAIVAATQNNQRAGEALQWAFTGERPLDEVGWKLAFSSLPAKVAWSLGWDTLALLPPFFRHWVLDR